VKILSRVNHGIKTRVALLTMLFVFGYLFSSISVSALENNQPGILKTFYDKKQKYTTGNCTGNK
jgi:hypothetical protein